MLNGKPLHEFVGYNSATGKARLYRQTMAQLGETFRSITMGDVPLTDPTAKFDEAQAEADLFAKHQKAYDARM